MAGELEIPTEPILTGIPTLGRAKEAKMGTMMEATMTAEEQLAMEQETNPWMAQATRFNEAAQRLNLDPGILKVLSLPTREIIVHIPVQMDDGTINVYTGYRVQHSSSERRAA
jgi:glutamate dehydrogenase (NAD(P)+)